MCEQFALFCVHGSAPRTAVQFYEADRIENRERADENQPRPVAPGSHESGQGEQSAEKAQEPDGADLLRNHRRRQR